MTSVGLGAASLFLEIHLQLLELIHQLPSCIVGRMQLSL